MNDTKDDDAARNASPQPRTKDSGLSHYTDDVSQLPSAIPAPKDIDDNIKCVTSTSVESDHRLKLEKEFSKILENTFEKYTLSINANAMLDALLRVGLEDHMRSILDYYQILDNSHGYSVAQKAIEEARSKFPISIDLGDYSLHKFIKRRKTTASAQVPNETPENLIIRQKECGSSYRLSLRQKDKINTSEFFKLNPDFTQIGIQDILSQCNGILKPLRKPLAFWDKMTIIYLLCGFLVFMVPGVLLAVFVHFSLSFVFFFLFLCGFPCLLFFSKRKAHGVLLRSHIALSIFIHSYNLHGYCPVIDGQYI